MYSPTNDVADTTDGPMELTENDRHLLLAADRRRQAVDLLSGKTTPVDLEELASGIAARENGIDAEGEAVDRVATALHHIHLPKLDEVGILSYDPEAHRIDPSGVPSGIVPYGDADAYGDADSR